MSDEARPLTPGEGVTLLLPDHVVMVEVNMSSKTGFTVTLSSRGAKTYESPWRLNEEGVSWLRGYHLADSNEVKAARGAQALSTTAQQPPTIEEVGVPMPNNPPRNVLPVLPPPQNMGKQK